MKTTCSQNRSAKKGIMDDDLKTFKNPFSSALATKL